jgi:hypothetical protein
MKHLLARLKGSIAALALLLALRATAAPVTFWYAGYVKMIDNPSNALPFAVSEGMPFAGRLTYDSSLVTYAYTNLVGSGSYSSFSTSDTAGYAVLFQIAGHVVTNKSAAPFSYVGQTFIGNNYQNEDTLQFSVGAGGDLQLDGAPLGNPNLVPPRFSSLTIELADQTQTALNHSGLPTAPPDLAKFGKRREIRWEFSLDDGNPTRLFGVSGTLTVLSTNELVFLTQTPLTNKTTRLSWPRLNSGFTLQTTTNIASGNWQTATNAVTQNALENTVTVATGGIPRFYRLKK